MFVRITVYRDRLPEISTMFTGTGIYLASAPSRPFDSRVQDGIEKQGIDLVLWTQARNEKPAVIETPSGIFPDGVFVAARRGPSPISPVRGGRPR